MAFFGSADSSPSLITSVRTFARVAIAILHTRLDLLTTELGEEAFRLLYLVIAGVIALMCLHGAFFFLMVFIIALVWESPYRLWVIGGIFLVYLIIAIVCAVVAANMIKSRPRFLGQTLDELKKDVEGFKSAVTPTPAAPETKP